MCVGKSYRGLVTLSEEAPRYPVQGQGTLGGDGGSTLVSTTASSRSVVPTYLQRLVLCF